MKNPLYLLPVILASIMVPESAEAKVLIVVGQTYYAVQSARIVVYAEDIQMYDGKTVEVIPFSFPTGTNVQQCKQLWTLLESKYSAGKQGSDPVEGAVLIGNIPVPQFNTGSVSTPFFEPFDYYYMDIWDSRTDAMYPDHDMTPFNTDTVNTGYFSTKYNVDNGDGKIDIWVSRIYGVLLSANKHLRSSAPGGNPNTILDSTGIYNEYLDRLHKRYTEVAQVPSRGFAIGGLGDNGYLMSLQDVLTMHLLNLPMYVEFDGGAVKNTGEGNAFNFMSQLQAGPKGGTTLGAYNGTIFPSERNARNCTYTQLTDARSYAPYSNRIYSTLDNSGWEWAGIYSHSDPYSFAFNYVDGIAYNGYFSSGTFGPFWGNSMRRTGGYVPASGNPSGYYFYYNCNGISTDPYGNLNWRGKRAHFQYKVRASGTYSVYLYYSDNFNNCSNGTVKLAESKLNASGYSSGGPLIQNLSYSMSMKTHLNRDGTSNWERVFYGVTLNANNMATVFIDANGQDGEVIADAVRFVCTSPAIDDKVDNVEPITAAAGSTILSTQGFYTNDWVDRSFQSMQDENGTTHDKFSKTPFYLTCTCGTNNFIARINTTTTDNLGNLLALGHNGLICMGTSGGNTPGRASYSTFTNALASGKDFGQAFIDQVNSSFIMHYYTHDLECMYALLGAGTLRAQQYVQFGSALEQNKTVSTAVTNNSTKPVLIRGVTVTSAGTYTVTSTVTTTGQNCAGSEIVILPETEFQNGSTVTINAN